MTCILCLLSTLAGRPPRSRPADATFDVAFDTIYTDECVNVTDDFPTESGLNGAELCADAVVDGGNVYKDYSSFSASELRYSAGLGFSWLSPFGLLNFSYAVPFKDQPGDDTEEFQFTFGTNF